jgi:hypothetical protein
MIPRTAHLGLPLYIMPPFIEASYVHVTIQGSAGHDESFLLWSDRELTILK